MTLFEFLVVKDVLNKNNISIFDILKKYLKFLIISFSFVLLMSFIVGFLAGLLGF